MSQYSDYVEKHTPRPNLIPTDWDYVRRGFDDIIDGEILDGNKEGNNNYPRVKKTIRIKYGGGALHASEHIHDRAGEPRRIIQFEYDWLYSPTNPNVQWKFHFDQYHPQHLWPATKHFHEHDEPDPRKTEHNRLSNFSHRDVCTVLGTVHDLSLL